MPSPPISKNMWLSLGEALLKTATELLGQQAPRTLLTHPERHQRLFKDAEHDLLKAIESGQATVHIDSGKT